MNALVPLDPASLSWPPTLPIEIVLRTASIREICEGYGLTRDDYDALRKDQSFQACIADLSAELKKDKGLSFKLKARLQSEELLKTSWKLIHSNNDEVPPNVKADLIKFTWRVAGLEPDKMKDGKVVVPLQINLNLG
jgi:hypothetical protein